MTIPPVLRRSPLSFSTLIMTRSWSIWTSNFGSDTPVSLSVRAGQGVPRARDDLRQGGALGTPAEPGADRGGVAHQHRCLRAGRAAAGGHRPAGHPLDGG